MTKDEALKLALEALENASDIMDSWAQKRQDDAVAAIKEALAQSDYKSTFDHQLMENAQGELERIKLVQTGIGIEQRAEEAYEAAKQRSWVGVSDEVAQPEQDWIERERAVGYREGHQNALKQMAQPEQKPVAWPKTPAEISDIIGSSYVWREHKISDVEPHESDKYCVTAHDLLEAFENWNEYTTPPQRKPLTDGEILSVIVKIGPEYHSIDLARAIEAAHGIKGEA